MKSTKVAAGSNADSKNVAKTSPRKSQRSATSAKAKVPGHAPRPRSDDADAFIRDPDGGPVRTRDDLAEMLGEDFLEGATQGDERLDDELDRTAPAEIGGPFVVTRAREELAFDVDASNPVDATVEPIPRPIAGLVQRSVDDLEGELDEDAKDDEDDEDDEDEG